MGRPHHLLNGVPLPQVPKSSGIIGLLSLAILFDSITEPQMVESTVASVLARGNLRFTADNDVVSVHATEATIGASGEGHGNLAGRIYRNG